MVRSCTLEAQSYFVCKENVHALYTEYDSMLFQTPSIIRFHLSVLAEGSILALQISANWVAVVFVYQRGTKWCVCLHDNERLSSVREAVKEVIRVAHRCSVSDPSRSKQVWQKWLFRLLRKEMCWTKVNGFHSCPPLSSETLVRSAHVPLLELNCCWLYRHLSWKVASEGFSL